MYYLGALDQSTCLIIEFAEILAINDELGEFCL
jgi:hypothetical protein